MNSDEERQTVFPQGSDDPGTSAILNENMALLSPLLNSLMLESTDYAPVAIQANDTLIGLLPTEHTETYKSES